MTDHPVESLVSTSYVERQNLTMRIGMRCITRLPDDSRYGCRCRGPRVGAGRDRRTARHPDSINWPITGWL